MTQGWVSVWRKIQEKGWYTNSKYVHLWLHLILKANHEGSEFLWNKEIVKLKRGQCITGRKKLALETGISEGTIENILNLFEKEQQIAQQKTNKFRLITVINYDKFQLSEQQTIQQSNNRVTTKLQQNDTNNNDNKDNNENNVKTSELSSQVNQVMDIFYTINPSLNYGNKTSRSACEWLIGKYGLEKVLRTAELACSIHGQPYSPTITTPHQLKEKLSQLGAFKLKQDNSNKGITII